MAPIPLGPVTRERAARVLEQQLGAVWAAVLESHGRVPADWRVVVGDLALEPIPPAADGALGRAPAYDEVNYAPRVAKTTEDARAEQ